MNICFSMKQSKVIKTLLYHQDLYNENILRLKVDISEMILDEAHKIVNKMQPAKKDTLNEILLGKIQSLRTSNERTLVPLPYIQEYC